MGITRRGFLKGAGAGVAVTAFRSSLIPAVESAAPARASHADIRSVRDQFELTKDYIHLATFYLASHPRMVQDAIDKYRRSINENPYLVVEHSLFESPEHNKILKVTQAAADYFQAKPEEFAITGSTTMGLALVYNGLRFKSGQEILTTQHDHYSHHESIRLAAEKSGATFRKIALYDSFASISEDSIVDRIRTALRPQTRAVGITWVHSSSGLKLPVGKISAMIQEVNRKREESNRILLIVDGVHGFGVEDDTAASLGCDFFVAGTHKWIFGPRGTGIIWAHPAAWAQTQPTIPTFYGFDVYGAWMQNRIPVGPTRASWVAPGGFHAFEHHWAIADAFRFHLQIGKKRIAERIHALNLLCKEGLRKMPHVKLHTPVSSALSAGLICFDIEGMKPEEVIRRLRERKILGSVTPYGTPYARLAPSLLNTEEEVEITLREVSALRNA